MRTGDTGRIRIGSCSAKSPVRAGTVLANEHVAISPGFRKTAEEKGFVLVADYQVVSGRCSTWVSHSYSLAEPCGY